VSGLFSMVGRNADAVDQSNHTNAGYSPYDAIYGRIFFDAAVTDRLGAFVQLYTSGNHGEVILAGAYARYDHTPSIHIEAGLIPTPVGEWAKRTYADKNPLVSVPAMYQFKTSLDDWQDMQHDVSDILEDRGLNEYAPLVYDFCWNTGVHGYASVGSFDFGVALLNGSLGSTARAVVYDRPDVAAHLSWVPSPYLTLGVWGADGAYLPKSFQADLPPGKGLLDYQQKTVGGLIHASAGHCELYAEGLLNRFEHPYLGNLDNAGGYADIKYEFATRWWAAARVDMLAFARLSDPEAHNERWDFPLKRYEVGIGRWFSERALVKLVTQIIRHTDAPAKLDGETYALQFTVKM
jgi:hypothetical protein